jgi:D-alanyl-D-alanine carboxypeptidase/D-alanyl-D-alanine-endopeptidase (penicillin-binding protein 4)
VVAVLVLVLSGSATALARPRARAATNTAVGVLTRSLALGMRQAGSYSGADVIDLTTGQTLYAHAATTARLPASVQKLYTATTALTRLGPDATFNTSLLETGQMREGTLTGTLYLRGGGDPTFGAAGFDRENYATGATVQQLVVNLVAATGLRALHGSIVADESLFDSDRGTPATNNQPSTEVEGELSALAYDRGWADSSGSLLQRRPAVQAGDALLSALRGAGVAIARGTTVRSGRTPAAATALATVSSPPLSELLALTLAPSDNFFAETLLKDIGARFGGAGTTAAGAAVVRSQMARSFGIHPELNDGSGLSRADLTTPAQVVTLLRAQATDPAFTAALAVAGESGTLQDRMRASIAQGRCRGKTGTLSDVSNLAGYCQAADGHMLAFAFLMNGVYPDAARPIQDRMAEALARYDG